MKPILSLEKAEYGSIESVGGKAASLGNMLKAGFPVPPGFVITTEAYKKGGSAELTTQILAAFDELGVERVAVRSSAVAEDSSEASWAGQLDTVL
ncbi:MAG TPA: PEP/pyruvate-binding domain-containing protein, partial [Candidatus Saccharimonadales bacterium]|nr:PEP/pyruvate-binding domain-containing protein [Candidatus Saccharimonadales bacterium]